MARPDNAAVASLAQVTFTYRDASVAAVCAIDLVLAPGEMVGIMGASGAGKSTLVKCLNRLIPNFEDGDFKGIVWIAGRVVEDTPVCELAPIVGMVFQDFEAQLFSTNVGLEVAFAMQQIGLPRDEIVARIGPALEAVGLTGFEKRDPTSLSGGEKQRLAIAAVLALRPRVIIFDEPTTDLDPEGRAEVLALISSLRGQGLSLVVIEHEAEALRDCNRILLMRSGAVIAQGAPSEVLSRRDLLDDCGVRPPDLDRGLAQLGISECARNVDAAEAIIRSSINLSGAPPNLVRKYDMCDRDTPIAEVRQVVFAYQGPNVLDGVDLLIAPGEFLAIVGQNGSGKTTLAKHLVGLLRPTTGSILLDGKNRLSLSVAETAALVGYVFQNPDHQIFSSTVEDEVAFGPRNFGLDGTEIERRVGEVLRAVNLEYARARDPFLLSKGERQRLAVASVLALRPKLLILDEPTTGLDYREQQRLMGLIRELNESGIAIVIITHTPWLVAEYARRVVLMRQGRVRFDGPVCEFFEHDELLRESAFRPPEITILSRRFGFVALNVEEFVKALTLQPLSE